MMADAHDDRRPAARPDVRARLDRDLERYARREPGSRSFWRSLRVLGAIGWPIVLTTVGGAFMGRWLDARWSTGIQLTLILLVGGAIAGAVMAWQMIQPDRR